MYIYTCIHVHIHLLERKEVVFLIYINTYQYTLKYGWSGRYMNAHANTNEHTTRVHMHNPHCNTDMCISFRLLFETCMWKCRFFHFSVLRINTDNNIHSRATFERSCSSSAAQASTSCKKRTKTVGDSTPKIFW